MAKKNALTFVTVIERLIQGYFERVANLMRLAGFEARLAGKTLLRISALCFILGMLLISTWLGALALLFIFLLSLQLSWLLTSAIVVALNISLLLTLVFFIMHLKKDMLFPATRRQLSRGSKRHRRRRVVS